jgi:hypothetical protein
MVEFEDAASKLHSKAMRNQEENNYEKKTNLSLSAAGGADTLSENSFFNASFFAPSEEF